MAFTVDDHLLVSYEYNPLSIDIIKEARSEEREDYTITDVPFMYISSIEELDVVSGEPTGTVLEGSGGFGWGGFGMGAFGVGEGIDYWFVVEEPTLRHSELDDCFIEVAASFVGEAVRVNYYYASAIPPIQAFMDDRDEQSMTASLLARHFIPVFVDSTTDIRYDIEAADVETALTSDEMMELIEDFINDVDEGNPLELTDLVDVFYDNGAVFVNLEDLYALRGELHHHDGTEEFVVPDDSGVMEIPDETIPDPTDRPLSPRIARFRARNITLTRSSV